VLVYKRSSGIFCIKIVSVQVNNANRVEEFKISTSMKFDVIFKIVI